jgi:phage terminase large subunit GpA-like protein
MSARDLPPELLAQWPHLPVPLRQGLRAAVAKGLEALKTPEPLTLDQWAERHFYLSAESSQGEKRWESYPFQRGMLCAMGDDDIEEVDVRKSARVGYTKMLLASIGYDAHHKRRNQCLWQPTDGDSDEFCKAELEPMLRDVKAMASVFPRFMAKSKANTLNMKKFLGSLLYLKGGTSAGNFRRMTLQSAKLDEFDGFDQKIEKSADPFTLAYKRLEGATYPKIICGTTPRIKGLSHIEKREAAALASLRYCITCPHCDVEHPLIWGGKDYAHGFKWDAEDPEATARHVCPHCHGSITQSDYLRIANDGEWVSVCGNYRLKHLPVYQWTDGDGNPLVRPPRHVAFHVWTAYSPQTTWAAIVRQFLQCVQAKKAGDKAPLEGFINETLGEAWEEEVDKADTHALMSRAEDYPLRRVPVGGLQLVAGVDVQDKRWEVTIWAIGRGEEMWVVDYQVIDGNPADERDWEERLHPYLQSPLVHVHGAPMKIAATAIDTGGHYTHQCYNFCRVHVGHKYFAIKGESREGKPIKGRSSAQDVNHRGRIIKAGVKLWMVGTDTAKDLFFGRLKVTQPGAGYVHFSKHLPVEWFKGLTSEVRRAIRTARGETHRWVKTAARNEPLDTTVYAMFCSQMLDHYKMTDAQWRRLENDLLPDLFDHPAPSEIATITISQNVAGTSVDTAQAATENVASAELKQLAFAQLEIRDPAPAVAAPAPPPVAIAQPPKRTAAQAKRMAPPPAASPFASSEWMSRL